jgi:hypothetical protein
MSEVPDDLKCSVDRMSTLESDLEKSERQNNNPEHLLYNSASFVGDEPELVV